MTFFIFEANPARQNLMILECKLEQFLQAGLSLMTYILLIASNT